MKEEKNNDIEILKINSIDYLTTALKAGLGAIPYAGSLISELAGTIIYQIKELTESLNLSRFLVRDCKK